MKYLVLGTGESCYGDSARRSGNEFLFQQLAAQAVETLDGLFEGVETVDRKIVVTCPHCFNTIGREYRQLGANYTVLHHTQLLNRLVRDKKLVPVSPVSEDITYHDPCYLGRHNKVYEAPRELIGAAGATLTEMPRHADRSFCCGAGGARMWMEEHIGKRINHERVDEALATGAATVATGCPFCRVMVTDGVNDRQEEAGRSGVEVLDVAQILLGSLEYDKATLPEKGTAAREAEKRAAEAPRPAPEAAAPAEAPVEEEAPAEQPIEAKAAPAPAKGLGIAGGAKKPGAKKAAPAAEPPAAKAETAEAPSAPAAPTKGLGMAAGAKRPGAKKTAAPAAEKPAAEPAAPAEEAKEKATPAAPAAPVKGLGIAAGAKRPGAKKAASPAAPAPAAAEPEAKPEPEPEEESNSESAPPAAPVKGLGIARGARPPGKR